MTDETKLDTPEEHDGWTHRGAGADTTADAPDAAGRTASQPKQPLITAIEIENFKGIGAPVRIELRPITLLFGRNSAGKSTIIQALCYAHEILSHRNVDVHKTELGGDQIDLGGFRQFVHGHDLDRVIRLRFDLNLEGWRVPAPLVSAIQGALNTGDPDSDEENRQWFDRHNPTNTAGTGWVAFTAAWDRSRGEPALTSYEVGVNSGLVGRIEAADYSDAKLAFNWTHPLFEPLGGGQPAPAHSDVRRVGETTEPDDDEWQLRRAMVGLRTPVPDWEKILDLDIDFQGDLELEGNIGGPFRYRFDAFVSSVVVGLGRTLHDELARLRYIGPLRELHQRTGGPSDPYGRGHWSDGSGAWDLLAERGRVVASRDGNLLDEVNDWLERAERLDTQYRLRRRSTITLAVDDVPLISLIQFRERLAGRFRRSDGAVDLDGWVRSEAERIADLSSSDADEVAARITADNTARESPDSGNVDWNDSAEDLLKTAREWYRLLVETTAEVDDLAHGDGLLAYRETLVRAIAQADERIDIQLVSTRAGIPVRTSDIGVGVSQILPVVVAALDPNGPGITAIEQAELHVHPKMQVELGDLFAQGVGRGGIFLIETHSEHLLLRIMRRMLQTCEGTLPEGAPALRPEDVSVLLVEPDGTETLVREMPLNERGELVEAWPGGFFEEDLRELFDVREPI